MQEVTILNEQRETPSGYVEAGSVEQVTALYAALGKAQGAFTSIHRSKEVFIRSEKGNYKFNYAPMEDLIGATRPALAENGLTVLTPAINDGTGYKVLVIVAHADGGRIMTEFRFEPVRTQSGAVDMKQNAGVITYTRRYGYSSVLNLAADDDADDQGDSGHDDRRESRTVDRSTGEIKAYLCVECDAELQEVRFRDGTLWSPMQLATYGNRKHGRVLCMTHYREANDARKRAEQSFADGTSISVSSEPEGGFSGSPTAHIEKAPREEMTEEWVRLHRAATGFKIKGDVMNTIINRLNDQEFGERLAELRSLVNEHVTGLVDDVDGMDPAEREELLAAARAGGATEASLDAIPF